MAVQGVVLFHGLQAVLRAEKVLQKARLTVKLVPTPRQFSSDCGVALRFNWSEVEQVRNQLTAARVEIAAIHSLE
jgi:Putative Se/S carrier protein-like